VAGTGLVTLLSTDEWCDLVIKRKN